MKLNKKNISVSILFIFFILLSFLIGVSRGKSNVNMISNNHETDVHNEPTVWTCSMHPSIQLPKFGQCPICFMDLIPLDPSSIDDDPNASKLSMSETAKKLAGITTTQVIQKNVSSDIRMVGKVDFDESRTEMITARISGRIDRLYVDYSGVKVKRGDHLAEIYSPELLSLQKELIESYNAKNGVSEVASSMIKNSIEKTFEAAKEKLRLLGFKENELKEILERGSTSDHMTIRSSQNGLVIKRLVDEGTYVKLGHPLFHIADLSKVWVKLEAYESDLSWIRLGQTVSFTVEAYPGDKFIGKISLIDPVVNPKTRTVMIRVIVNNNDGRLKPDMFVKAIVKVGVSNTGRVVNSSLRNKYICPMHLEIVKKAEGNCPICSMELVHSKEMGYIATGSTNFKPLIIPASAPLFTGERAIVYVEDKNAEKPTFEGREVILGPKVGNHYIVKSGLQKDEHVVVRGAFKLDGELQIKAKPSMMNPKKEVRKIDHVASLKIDPVKNNISSDIKTSLDKIFETYLNLSTSLAADNYKNSLTALKNFKKAIDNTVTNNNKEYKQLNASLDKIKIKTNKIQFIQNIDEARNMFETFSNEIIALEKTYGHDFNKVVHLTFCSMAFNDKGAYWLQTMDVVNNPYFGSKMLKCGEIRESYKPNN